MRKNTKELLRMVEEGCFNREELIRDLLNFLSDAEVGQFMEQYGYEDTFEPEDDLWA